jgi:DNA-binding IclR family transcriptional regulator
MTRSSDGEDPASPKSSSAIGKAFNVLLSLRKTGGPTTLTALSEDAGIAPSSAHTILSQLLTEDAVAQDEERRYQLGPTLLYLGAAYARSSRIYRAVWIELVTAANQNSVTAAMAVPWHDHHLVLNAHRAANSDVAVPYGGRVPLDAASWGKVYYATSGQPLPKRLGRYTAASITDLGKFKDEIESTNRLGYAVDAEEYQDGIVGVCSAVTSESGYEGLISFLAPKETLDELSLTRLGILLAGLASRASLALGDEERLRVFGGT